MPCGKPSELVRTKRQTAGTVCSGRFENGSGNRTRTCDRLINSQLLYQLSYAGSKAISTAGCGYLIPSPHRIKGFFRRGFTAHEAGGADQIRTGVQGFAILCVASPPPRRGPVICHGHVISVNGFSHNMRRSQYSLKSIMTGTGFGLFCLKRTLDRSHGHTVRSAPRCSFFSVPLVTGSNDGALPRVQTIGRGV